jgi:DnaJ-class molecular chaperone
MIDKPPWSTRPTEKRRRQHRPQYLVELDLPEGATKAQVEAQFRRLAKVHHPDCGGDAEDFKRIRAAYEEAIARRVT